MGKTNKMLILKGGGASGYYFCPPVGFPEANTVFKHSDVQLRIHSVFKIFAGTKYEFILFTQIIYNRAPQPGSSALPPAQTNLPILLLRSKVEN